MVPIERLITSGLFSLDGEDFDVDNNVWIVGGDEIMIIDPAHDAEAIVAAVAERTVVGVVCTHGHNDHINAAVEVADRLASVVYLHPSDRMLWDVVHPQRPPGVDLHHGMVLDVDGVGLEVLHTPGHSPGSCCLHLASGGVVFTGDTLFEGGPGATGRSYSDYPTIVSSIESRLLTLSPDTAVNTGHGPSTTIGAEAPGLAGWKDSH
ncbi:MBL fold metallo-hydrolase [soil metagenome]